MKPYLYAAYKPSLRRLKKVGFYFAYLLLSETVSKVQNLCLVNFFNTEYKLRTTKFVDISKFNVRNTYEDRQKYISLGTYLSPGSLH